MRWPVVATRTSRWPEAAGQALQDARRADIFDAFAYGNVDATRMSRHPTPRRCRAPRPRELYGEGLVIGCDLEIRPALQQSHATAASP